MRKSRNTSYRPEQFKLQKYLLDNYQNLDIKMEYPIYEEKNGFRKQLVAVADLYDKTNNIIYRLSSGSHKGLRNRLKYEDQKEKLEELGYKVEDIEKDSEWEWLWLS